MIKRIVTSLGNVFELGESAIPEGIALHTIQEIVLLPPTPGIPITFRVTTDDGDEILVYNPSEVWTSLDLPPSPTPPSA